MSLQKIKSKNLTYDASLPPFLRALHAQTSGASDAPDPVLASRRCRPRGKGRSASEEAEDAPLVVDENGNVLAGLTADDDGGVVQSVTANATDGDDHDNGEKPPTSGEKHDSNGEAQAQKVASFGSAGRKRKAGKVVGDNDDASESNPPTDKRGHDVHVINKAKPTKKAKKIKLSFDDDAD